MHMEDAIQRNVRGLDLARRDGGLLVVCGKLGSLSGDALEDVVDERVQDAHGAVGDTSVGVDLLENCGNASANTAEWNRMQRMHWKAMQELHVALVTRQWQKLTLVDV